MKDMIVKTVEIFFLFLLFDFLRSLLIIKDAIDPPVSRLHYQPLFGKEARAPPPNSHERAAEIEPTRKRPPKVSSLAGRLCEVVAYESLDDIESKFCLISI